jgi:hypothetical protein
MRNQLLATARIGIRKIFRQIDIGVHLGPAMLGLVLRRRSRLPEHRKPYQMPWVLGSVGVAVAALLATSSLTFSQVTEPVPSVAVPPAPVVEERATPDPADLMPYVSESCANACQLELDEMVNGCPGATGRAGKRAASAPPANCVPLAVRRFEACLHSCPAR